MFERDSDQELFAATTNKFIASNAPLQELRKLSTSFDGYERDYWRRGAELGWTSLVVPEAAGGGSISNNGVVDLSLIAFEFGRTCAPGPLLPTNVVAAALARWGDSEQIAGPLQELVGGSTAATWALSEPPPHDQHFSIGMQVRIEGDVVVLSGTKAPVEAAGQAEHLLVVARSEHGLVQVLVPASTPGVRITPLRALDLTRRFGRIEFDDVRLPRTAILDSGGAEASVAMDWLLDLALVIQLSEFVGAMQWAFDTTVEWAFNRYSFGRPLASYQELKHRFADMKMWLEGSYAIVGEAAAAFAGDAPNRSQLASAAKTYVGNYGAELVQDCVQMHGGIGVTSDHDLHIYLRRVATNVALFGSPAEHAERLTSLLERNEDL